MGLAQYQQKRHFSRTPEPAGKTVRNRGWHYAIQKHDASHLHYDFRLELDGVLKSWAVPKGPSLDPAVKRLAVQVEDHPVSYREFEGIIPQGEYGGGTVMLWDTGKWEPEGDPRAGLKAGKLKFKLYGQKLQGGWTLVRTHRSQDADKPQWLLIKERDQVSRPTSEGDILVEQPTSAATGRSLEDIAAGKKATATRKKPTAKVTQATPAKTAKRQATASRSSAAGSLPARIDVQLATLIDSPPTGDEWLHEVKFDGYRMICRIEDGEVRLITRNHNDWTSRLPGLAEAAGQLPVQRAVLDGEVVVVQANGTTDFQALQNAFREGQVQQIKYMVFDLLYLDGQSLMDLPLEDRKRRLKELLQTSETGDVIRYSDHIEGHGEKFQQQACRLHLEGMISKRRDQPYRPGRGLDWLKVKCLQTNEYVIGGFTDPRGARTGLGALLVGFHDAAGDLHYAGKVGTGFNERVLLDLSGRLNELEQAKSPFVDLQQKTGDARSAHWVKPQLVGQFKYSSRTRDGRLRHASFQGLREDKPARDVKQDEPVSVEAAVSASRGSKKKAKRSKPKKSTSAGNRSNSRASPMVTQTDDATQYDQQSETFAGVRLTHPDKLLYADDQITKLEMARYYHDVARWILPHLQHRPLVLVRCPDGQTKECFYQKHPGVGTPGNLRQIPIQEKHKRENYLVIDDVNGLVSLTQIGALELHAWGSREDKLELPDRLIFDLDPAPELAWKQVIQSARQVRDFLAELGLQSFLKTTGGKGLHLVIPIARRLEWEPAKAFCRTVAEALVQAAPDQFTSNMAKKARTDRIFVDYLRNDRGATAVVPYSTRSRPGAPVSMPIAWDELTPEMHSDSFNIHNALRRLTALRSDPWADFFATKQSLPAAVKKLDRLMSSGNL